LSDPAFALAFHCVEARIAPALPAVLPREIWFGLLHAGTPQTPLLTSSTAVALVLRALGHAFAQLDAAARKAALRLFFADPADVRPGAALDGVLRALPPAWGLRSDGVPQLVAAAAATRVSLAEASALCARLVRSCADAARKKPGARLGGLAQLQETGAGPAAPEEIAELAHTSRRHPEMTGLKHLLGLL
jgi:3-methyladenine DNA glycosylase/8-oxoguanine DNA glycosylase